MQVSLPDLLSLSRIPCAVLVIILYSGDDQVHFVASVAVVSIALATDFLDGALARRLGRASKQGYILDGLGDRAMYIGLALAFLTQQKIGLVATWMLIFREVAIYAARLLSTEWFEVNRSVRFLSRLHAGLLRIWILSIVAGDGVKLYAGTDPIRSRAFVLAQTVLLVATLAVSYYTLMRHLGALLAATDV
jgi:phosphatidylglycerophosphate synthase